MTVVGAGLSRAEEKVPFRRREDKLVLPFATPCGGKEQPALLAQSGLFATAV